MSFHLGKPILVMIVIATIAGGFIATRKAPPKADLTLWTFTSSHTKTYESIVGGFEHATGQSVDIQQLSIRAENTRLESMFMSGQGNDILPDVVEIEISQVGRFFRPPLDQIGLLPLNDFLKRDGWDHRIVRQRLDTWSKQGVIFGIPHDVHPVAIAYRKDLFDQAGVDLEAANTWPAFHDACVQFQDYWKAQNCPTRHALELSRASSDNLMVMLLQRGVNLIDAAESIHINDPIVAQTTAFYAQLVAGQKKIADESAAGVIGAWTNDALHGNLCAFITADWRVFYLKLYAPELEGKLRVMPLPRFEPTDAPTSTWGGTMIGITRRCPQPEKAWKLIEFLCLSPEGLRARQEVSSILPPVTTWWDQPVYHREDPFFGGQRVDELYIDLARQVPRRIVTAMTPVAEAELSVVLNRAVSHLESEGADGLESYCQRWLDVAASDLKARIKQGKFEK